jgi:hypothetical protein
MITGGERQTGGQNAGSQNGFNQSTHSVTPSIVEKTLEKFE